MQPLFQIVLLSRMNRSQKSQLQLDSALLKTIEKPQVHQQSSSWSVNSIIEGSKIL